MGKTKPSGVNAKKKLQVKAWTDKQANVLNAFVTLCKKEKCTVSDRLFRLIIEDVNKSCGAGVEDSPAPDPDSTAGLASQSEP